MRHHYSTLKTLIPLMVVVQLSAPAALSQTKHWNIKPREKSQTALSRAINILKGRAKPSKGQKPSDEALRYLEDATRHDPSDPAAWSCLGIVLDMHGKYQQALEALTKADQLQPNDPETGLGIALTYYLAHNYTQAIDVLTRLLAGNGSPERAAALLAYCYLKTADYDKAQASFQQYIRVQSGTDIGYYGLASINYLKGNLGEALNEAQQAESVGHSPASLLLLAKLSYLQGDSVQGQRFAQAAVRQARVKSPPSSLSYVGFSPKRDFAFDPFTVHTFDNGYLLQARAGNWEKDAGKKRAQLARQGDLVSNLAAAEAELIRAPNDYSLMRDVALLKLSAEQYDDAAQKFTHVLGLCSSCHVDLLHLARALSAAGKEKEAALAARQYQKLFPGQKIAPLFLSIASKYSEPEQAQDKPLFPPPAQKPPAEANTGF